MGFLESEQTISIPLPSSIEEFERKWKVIEKPQTTPAWDFLWTLPSEEAREKLFLHEAITTHPHTIPEPPSYPTEPTHIADAALKVKKNKYIYL